MSKHIDAIKHCNCETQEGEFTTINDCDLFPMYSNKFMGFNNFLEKKKWVIEKIGGDVHIHDKHVTLVNKSKGANILKSGLIQKISAKIEEDGKLHFECNYLQQKKCRCNNSCKCCDYPFYVSIKNTDGQENEQEIMRTTSNKKIELDLKKGDTLSLYIKQLNDCSVFLTEVKICKVVFLYSGQVENVISFHTIKSNLEKMLQHGKDGCDGKDGKHGKDGKDGKCGPMGPPGLSGGGSSTTYLGRYKYTNGNNTQFTPPSGTKYIHVQMLGAGGNGGAATLGTYGSAGGGGGSGGYMEFYITNINNLTYSFTANAAGAAGAPGKVQLTNGSEIYVAGNGANGTDDGNNDAPSNAPGGAGGTNTYSQFTDRVISIKGTPGQKGFVGAIPTAGASNFNIFTSIFGGGIVNLASCVAISGYGGIAPFGFGLSLSKLQSFSNINPGSAVGNYDTDITISGKAKGYGNGGNGGVVYNNGSSSTVSGGTGSGGLIIFTCFG